jgi:hypothetical protein
VPPPPPAEPNEEPPTPPEEVKRLKPRWRKVARQPVVEDHVWFNDRWMVISLCDE